MRVSVTTLLFLSSLATATEFKKVKHVDDQSHLLARRGNFQKVKHSEDQSHVLVKRAEFKKVKHTEDQSHLLVRQYESCTGLSCAACFGSGNIVCEGTTCFNPSAGEQCCADGSYCVGSDTSCCGSAGGGTSYDDSETTTDLLPTATETDSSSPTELDTTSSPSEWSCSSSDTVDECCARGGSSHKWCSGDGDILPMECYDPSEDEECCADGFTCAGTGCCSDIGETAVTPTPTTAAFLGTAGGDSGFTDSFTDTFTDSFTDTFDLGGTSSASGALTTGTDSTTTSALSGDVTPASGGGSGSGSGSGSGDVPLLSVANSMGADLMLYAAGVTSLLGLVLVL